MLLAMLTYVMTMDEAVQPGGKVQEPVPAPPVCEPANGCLPDAMPGFNQEHRCSSGARLPARAKIASSKIRGWRLRGKARRSR